MKDDPTELIPDDVTPIASLARVDPATAATAATTAVVGGGGRDDDGAVPRAPRRRDPVGPPRHRRLDAVRSDDSWRSKGATGSGTRILLDAARRTWAAG